MIKSPVNGSFKRFLKRNRWFPTEILHFGSVESVPEVVSWTAAMKVNKIITAGSIYEAANQLSNLYVANFTFTNNVVLTNVAVAAAIADELGVSEEEE